MHDACALRENLPEDLCVMSAEVQSACSWELLSKTSSFTYVAGFWMPKLPEVDTVFKLT